MQQLFNVFQNIVLLTRKEQNLLSDAFISRQISKKHDLLLPGKISREIYFIEKGCLQLYYDKNGEDATIFIAVENMFVGAFASFLSRQPSEQGLRALEDCELLVLTHTALEELYTTLPKMNIIGRKLLEQRFLHAQSLVSSFVLNNPEERYLQMLQNRPEILQRVPQHVLATFLGITPVSLSRIRKRLSGDV